MITIDETNPCQAAADLRQAYANMVAGTQEAEIMFRAGPNGVERRVSFAKGDASRLQKLIDHYQGLCDAMNGGRRARRFGLATGGLC